MTALLIALAAVAAVGIVANRPATRRLELPGFVREPPTTPARVVAAAATRCSTPGDHGCERLTVRLSSGSRQVLDTFDPAIQGRVAVGDDVLVYRSTLPAGSRGPDGQPLHSYAFADFRRTGPLVWLALAFALIAGLTGGTRGVRALLGLGLSLATTVLFVVPAIAQGRSPVAVAAFGGLGVMLLTIPLVHGGGPKSIAACLGTAAALLITLALANLATRVAHLSGATSDAALFAQAAGAVSLRGLLLAGMVIGALGVLGDTIVTQASVVMALRRADASLGFRALVSHAGAVGRDHIAATVNTLVLAYTGASIPVLLIFNLSRTSLGSAVNTEAVAEAIAATLVGSIGLMLAVPITTAIAAWLAIHTPPDRLGTASAHAH